MFLTHSSDKSSSQFLYKEISGDLCNTMYTRSEYRYLRKTTWNISGFLIPNSIPYLDYAKIDKPLFCTLFSQFSKLLWWIRSVQFIIRLIFKFLWIEKIRIKCLTFLLYILRVIGIIRIGFISETAYIWISSIL